MPNTIHSKKYRRLTIIIAALLLISVTAYITTENVWTNAQTSMKKETEHFQFYFDGMYLSRIQPIISALEENYDRIVEDLEPDHMPRVRVKIWRSRERFYEEMEAVLGVRYAGADGYVISPEEFQIMLVQDAPTNAIHEFAHVATLSVNADFANNPRWLWEAVATYEAQQFVHPERLSYMAEGDCPTLAELNSDFGTGGDRIYAVGYALAEYIVEQAGMEAIRDLIRTNGDIQKALGLDNEEFEQGWHAWMESKYL